MYGSYDINGFVEQQLKLNNSLVLGFACAAGLLSSGAVLAAVDTVNNSNFSISYDDGTSFGSLTLSGNAISFDFINTLNPQTWVAESYGTDGLNSVSDSVTLTLTINNTAWSQGYRFGSVIWVEGGNYLRAGTSDTVGVTGALTAQSASVSNSLTADSLAVTQGFGQTASLADWSAGAALSASTACSGAGCVNAFASMPQTLFLTVNNSLFAQAGGGAMDEASITKTLGAGQFTLLVTQVPEASTWAMMAAGLGAVGFMARRRRVI